MLCFLVMAFITALGQPNKSEARANGEILIGGYNYSSLDTTWKITVPASSSIEILLIDINLPCSEVNLTIYAVHEEVSEYEEVGSICGTMLEVLNSKNTLWNVSNKNITLELRGDTEKLQNWENRVNLAYRFLPLGKSSSIIILNVGKGNVSVNPSMYENDVDYSWLVQTKYHNQILHLKFFYFDLEERYSFFEDNIRMEGCFDHLRVYDGYSENFPLLGEYCGNKQELAVASSGQYMFLTFHSDGNIEMTGFRAMFYSVLKGNTHHIQMKTDTPKAYTLEDSFDVYMWFINASFSKVIIGNWSTNGLGTGATLCFHSGRVDTSYNLRSNFSLEKNSTGDIPESSYAYLLIKVIVKSAKTYSSGVFIMNYNFLSISDSETIAILNSRLINTHKISFTNNFKKWIFKPVFKSYIKLNAVENRRADYDDHCLDEGFVLVHLSQYTGPFCLFDFTLDRGWSFFSHGPNLTLIFFSFKPKMSKYKLVVEQTDCQGILSDTNNSQVIDWKKISKMESANCWVWQYYVNNLHGGPHFLYVNVTTELLDKLADRVGTTVYLTVTARELKRFGTNCMDYYKSFYSNSEHVLSIENTVAKKSEMFPWIGFNSSCPYAHVFFSLKIRKYNDENKIDNISCNENIACPLVPIRPTTCGTIQFIPRSKDHHCEWIIALDEDLHLFPDDYSHFLLVFTWDACLENITILEDIEVGNFVNYYEPRYIHEHDISPYCTMSETVYIQTLSVGKITISYRKSAGNITEDVSSMRLVYKLLRETDTQEPAKCFYDPKNKKMLPNMNSTDISYPKSYVGRIFPQTGSCFSIGERQSSFQTGFALVKNKTWEDAYGRCKLDNGHLITINTKEEYSFFLSLFQKQWKTLTFKYAPYVAVYIGLEEKKDRTYRWLDDSPVTFTRWYSPRNDSTMYWQEEFQEADNKDEVMDNDLIKIMSQYLYQPVWDPSARCVVMIIKNPYIGGVWVKVPCHHQLSYSFTVCEFDEVVKPLRAGNTNYGMRSQLCPPQWNFVAGRCMKIIIHPTAVWFFNAKKVCQGNLGSLAEVKADDLSEIIYYLFLWKIDKTQTTKFIWLASVQDNGMCNILRKQNTTYDIQYVTCDNASVTSEIILCEQQVLHVKPECSHSQFKCEDGVCISPGNVCDGYPDCADGEDEEACTKCGRTSFRCRSSNELCVPITFYCDYKQDCPDGSDEEYCTYPVCSLDQHRCKDAACISKARTCDFIIDCKDGSDEAEELCLWDNNCTLHGGYECYISGQCIPASMQHDGQIDCAGSNQEDEMIPEVPICMGQNVFPCYDKTSCCPFHQVCVYDFDIFNKSVGCKDFDHLQGCQNYSCPGMFKCPNSFCIPINYVCNGITDCINGYDEENCDSYVCPIGYFRCKHEKWCLDQTKYCDGKVDCETGDDEKFCELMTARECPPTCKCVGYTIECKPGELESLPSVSRHMRAIFFSQNKLILSNETFAKYYFVGVLDLSWNNITELPENVFADLYNVMELVLSGNLLSVLEGSRFAIESLTVLDLSQNQLEKITKDTFSGLKSLEKLDLSKNNPSMVIEITAFDNIQITDLRTDSFRFCCLVKSRDGTHCSPEADEYSTCTNLLSNEGLRIFVWVLGLAAFIGNAFVVIKRIKAENSNMKVDTLLIINLGISDFLMGVYLLIIAGADAYYYSKRDDKPYFLDDQYWRSGLLCQLAGFLAALSSEMSLSVLVIITIDRFISTVLAFKMKPMTRKLALTIIFILWIVWILISALPFFGVEYFGGTLFYGQTAVCLAFTISTAQSKGWDTLVIYLIFNFGAILLIAGGYLAIFIHVRRSRKSVGRKQTSRDVAFTRNVSLIIATDFICWFPIIIAGYIALSGVNIPPEFSAWVAVFILPINSAINPILYTLSSVQCPQMCRKKRKTERSENTKQANVSSICKTT